MGGFTPEMRAKAAETRRQKAADRATKASAPVTVEQATEGLLPELMGLIRDLSGKVDALEVKVAQTGSLVPRLVPMQGAAPRPDTDGMVAGEARDGVQQLPVGTRGLELDQSVFYAYPQQFVPGQRVRINPTAAREGWAEGRTWADVLDDPKKGTMRCPTKVGKGKCNTPIRLNSVCPRCGDGPTVRGVRYLSKQGQWKYIVRVPGITQRNGLGDGFHQSELLAA